MAWMWCVDAAWARGPTERSDSEASPPGTGARPRAVVEAVDVDLVIHRGTKAGPSGRRLGRNRAIVRARARYRLAPSSATTPSVLTLLDFSGHLEKEPRELDEVALGGYADGPWTYGGTELTTVRAEGRADRLEVVRDAEAPRWSVTVPPGANSVVIEYEVTVPRRYWPFGCANGRCSLSGAVAPLPGRPARGGVYLPAGGQVVAPAQWHVEARFADVHGYAVDSADTQHLDGPPTDPRLVDQLEGQELLVWSRPLPTPGAPPSASGQGAGAGAVEYPTVVWGRRWHRLESLHRGVRITVLHPKARVGGRHPNEGRLQLRRDAPGRVMQIAEEGVDLAGEVLGEMAPESRMLVVQAPLRSQIAQFHPATLLVSDRAYEIVPAERFFKFHALEIARAVLEGLSHAWIRPHAEPSEALWTGGAAGFALVNVWQRRRELRDEYAQDLLRNFTFVPAVDRFLYTEQAQFSGAYFRGSDDELGPRNHALWFSHALPTGRRIHEKLTDLLSDEQLATFYATLADQPQQPARVIAEHAYGRQLDWFFDQWLGPYPAVDYAIADVEGERIGTGRGGPWRYRIEVVRDAAVPISEPVQLLVTERGGAEHYLVWNGDPAPGGLGPPDPGALGDLPPDTHHVFELETATKVRSVRLDPRARLEQQARIPTWPGGRADNHDPRFNDRFPPKFRFIYTGFGLSIAASELLTAQTPQARINSVTAFASFEGSLRRDLRRTGSLSVLTDRETVVAASAGANFYFLGKRNKQRRRLRLRTSFGGAWLTDAGLDRRGGTRLTESVQLLDDTTAFAWWPERGHVLGATVTANQVLRDVEGQPDHRYTLAVGGGWTQNFRLARDHVIATTVDMAMTFPLGGTAAEFRNLVRLGGIGGLSGYIGTEVLGRGGAWVQAEYRHLFVNDLPLNFVHLGWLRGFGGVAFGGAGSISSCAGFSDWFGAQSWYGQVGYGLQAQVQALGVTPQLIRLDVAVPLVRRDRQCLGEQFPDVLAEAQGLDPGDAGALLPPVTVNLLFNHPF